jgi:hypothetical protein
MSFSNNQPLPPLIAAGNEPIIEPPIDQRMTARNFDLESALKFYNPSEIAKFLSSQVGYDYEEASRQGFTDDEIISFATKQSETIPDVRAVSKPAAAVEGTIRGLMVGAPATYGMVKLGMAGARLGMFSPNPLVTAPLFAIAGGLVGLVGGSVVGGAVEDVLMPEEPVGPEARPFLEGGKTFGATLPSVIIPYKLPVDVNLGSRMYLDYMSRTMDPSVRRTLLSATGKGLSFLEKGLSKASQAAKTTPGIFGAAETIAAGGAGLGGGYAEKTDPGAIGTRLLYETAGGFFTPKEILINFFPAIKTGVSNLVQPLSRAGRQDIAARKLREIVEKHGEDVDAFIEALRKEPQFASLAKELGIDPGETRPALMFDSPALREMENRVIQGYPGMSPEIKQDTQANLNVIKNIIMVLKDQGDPGSLAAASQMRQKYFEELLTARLNAANATALKAAEGIPVSQQAGQEAGRAVETVARRSLEDARQLERQLYGRVDRTVPIEILDDSSILSAFRELEIEHPDLIPKEIRSRVGKLFPQVESATEAQDAYSLALGNLSESLGKVRTKMTESLGRLSSDDKFFIQRRLSPDGKFKLSDLMENPEAIPRERLIQLRDEISLRTSPKESFRYLDANNTAQFQNLSKEARKEILKVINGILDTSNFQTELNTLKAQGAPQLAASAMEEGTSTTLGQLMDFRSTMRLLGAQAAGRKDFQAANFYGRMNEAALGDLETVIMRETPEGADAMAAPLFEAYQYSRALNDVFRRAFAGDVLAKDADQVSRILPETLAAKLFSDGNDAVALRTQQLIEAAEFMSSKAAQEVGGGVPTSFAANLGTMTGAAEDMLRYAARVVVNPDTGQVKPEALAAFIRDNEVALNMFPSLLEDLSNAQTAQRLLDDVIDANSYAQKAINKQSAFARFLNSPDNPAKTLQTMLGSPGSRKEAAVQEFKKLIRFARRDSNPEVLDGLLDTVLENAYLYGGGGTGVKNLDIGKFRAYLYEPLGKGQLSIMQIMREQGVIPEETVGKLRVALTQAEVANKSLTDAVGASEGSLMDAPAKSCRYPCCFIGNSGRNLRQWNDPRKTTGYY